MDPLKHIDFIINPISGGKDKKKIESIIAEGLDSSRFSYSLIYTKGPGDAERLAHESTADIVCAVGGDGTLNEVGRGLLGTDKILALIPCGSGDGLALHLGISRKPAKAVKAINEGVPIAMDCGMLNGHHFFSISGTGLDATVSFRFANAGSRGLRTYISEALKTWKDFEFEPYDIEVDGRRMQEKAALVSVGNSNQWGNQARITPLADVSDGLLDVTIIKPFKTINIPGIVIKLMTGHLDRSRKAICLQGKHIAIYKSGNCIAHFDGDPVELEAPLEFEVIPSAIRILSPSHARRCQRRS